jgi:hypothetical protein
VALAVKTPMSQEYATVVHASAVALAVKQALAHCNNRPATAASIVLSHVLL